MELASGSQKTWSRLQLDSTGIPWDALIEEMQSLMSNHIHHDKSVASAIKGISTSILEGCMADVSFMWTRSGSMSSKNIWGKLKKVLRFKIGVILGDRIQTQNNHRQCWWSARSSSLIHSCRERLCLLQSPMASQLSAEEYEQWSCQRCPCSSWLGWPTECPRTMERSHWHVCCLLPIQQPSIVWVDSLLPWTLHKEPHSSWPKVRQQLKSSWQCCHLQSTSSMDGQVDKGERQIADWWS